MNGYDLDGTLCDKSPKRDKPYFKQSRDERNLYEQKKYEHYRDATLIRRPESPFVVISGRSVKYYDVTKAWMEKNNLHPIAILLMNLPRTRENMILHKYTQCELWAIKTYYEDDPEIAKKLAKLGQTVILVKGEE